MSNREVIDAIKACLRKAKDGNFEAVAIAMVGPSRIAALNVAGSVTYDGVLKEAVQALTTRIEGGIEKGAPPDEDASLGADHVCYDVASYGHSYDFIDWLILAEMQRVIEGAPAPLQVGFWLGGLTADVTNKDEALRWVDGVFRPALSLIGAVENDKAVRGQMWTHYGRVEIVTRFHQGCKIPRLRAAVPNDRFADYVTITLRELTHRAWRNSNIPEWLAFARWLRQKGEKVVFVRDTANAHVPIEDFETCPEASLLTTDRMALYDAAKVNFFGANGCHALALYSDKPWVVMQRQSANDNEWGQTKQGWEKSHGIRLGGQYPWSTPRQRIFWELDTFENLKGAWNQVA